MPDAIKKLREPAALAAVAFVGLSLLGQLIDLLFPPSSQGLPFSDRAYYASGQFLSADFAIGLAVAVFLANHAGGVALAKAKLVTLIALIEGGLLVVFGLVTLFASFGADGSEDKISNFLSGLGGLAALGIALWYTWLTWQQHAAAAAAAKPQQQQQQPWAGGYNTQQPGQYPGQPQPGQYQGQPQPGQYPAPGQPQPGPQTPPPGGFGWTPQQQGGAPGSQAADRTQLLPPVPSAPQGFAASPQPWNPAGPGGAPQLGQSQGGQSQLGQSQGGQPQPGQPPQPGQQPQPGQPGQPGGPFSVGDWRSDS